MSLIASTVTQQNNTKQKKSHMQQFDNMTLTKNIFGQALITESNMKTNIIKQKDLYEEWMAEWVVENLSWCQLLRLKGWDHPLLLEKVYRKSPTEVWLLSSEHIEKPELGQYVFWVRWWPMAFLRMGSVMGKQGFPPTLPSQLILSS